VADVNHGQEHPSPAIRLLTSEPVLAFYRIILLAFVGIASFAGQRMISNIDDTAKQVSELRREVSQRLEDSNTRLSDFKIEVARTNATTVATMMSIQNRMDAQSRRMDSQDGDIREINKKLYDGRPVRGAP
jgi:hypothetical protein